MERSEGIIGKLLELEREGRVVHYATSQLCGIEQVI